MNVETNIQSIAVGKNNGLGNYSGGSTNNNYNNNNTNIDTVSLDDFIGATANTQGYRGLVPAPMAGQQDKFLRGDATWSKVFEHITEDENGNIIIDGSTLNVNSPTYFNDVVYALSQLFTNVLHTDEIYSYTTDSSILIQSPTEFNAQAVYNYLVKYFGDAIFNGDQVTINSSLTVNGESIFNGDSYFNQDIYAKDITVENLTVTKLAHFFSLVIDKIKSVGGSIILSAANCVIDKVVDSSVNSNIKRLYWKATNDMSDTGMELNYQRGLQNEFDDYDLVICQTFNLAEYMEGETVYNVSNKYYWFTLGQNATGTEFTEIDGVNTLCNYMDVDTTSNIDGQFLPEKGDNLVLLGNKQDEYRQSAIILSAYKNIDSSIEAPSLAFYRGIKTYALSPYRYSWFASDTTRLRGEDIVFTSGETIQELIDNINSSIVEYDRYVWIKYSDNMPESSESVIYDIPTINTKYIGICNNSSLPTAPTDYRLYKWSRFVGTALTGQTTYYRISDLGDDPEHDSDMTPAVWSTTRPSVSPGDYLWTKFVYTYSDGTTSIMYNVSYIADSQTMTNVTTTYAVVVPDPSTGILPMTTPPDSAFIYSTLSDAMEHISLGDLLWSKTVYTYSDGTTTTNYGVNRIGADGSNGEPGDSEYIHLAYSNSLDGSLNFSVTYFNGALYIGTYVDTDPIDSSLYSDYEWKRLKGEPGTTVTLVSETIEYCVSSSGTEAPAGPWVTVMPVVQKGYYLWTRITLTYSDSSQIIYYTTTYYPYDGDGTPGADAEYYALIPLAEQAIVDKYGTLGANFQYQIMHISGDTGEIITPSSNGYNVRGEKTTVSGISSPINFTIDGTVSKFIDSSLQVNHHTAGNNKIRSFRMMLYDSSMPMESTARCVVPVFDSGATLEITDSIIATVQGNYTSLDGRIGSVENDVAGLGIWKDLIDASVNSNTTLINNLTGQVESNTQAIADISISPGEISSLVSRVTELEEGGAYNAGTINLFGFNDGWTYSSGTPMPKFYGAYANSSGQLSMTMSYNKIAENFDRYDYAFNTNKSDFSVSFELNSAINASTGYVTVNSVQKEIPETAWGDKVTLVYSDINTQSGLTVQFTGLSNSLIVKNIMITPGNVTGQCQESPADHYYSTNTGELGFNDWDLKKWTVSGSAPVEETDAPTHTIKDNKYPGQTTYLLKSTDSVSTMFSDTIDVSVGPYTMVYMAKSDGQVDITSSFGGGDSNNRTFTSTVLDNWILFVGHCYLNSSGVKTMTLGNVTNWNGNTKLWIAGAKIYKGYLSRSQVIQTFNSGSMIRQTADDIELSVYDNLRNRTGIDITTGQITLNAENTTIVGNLNLTDTENGITVFDSNGTPRIQIQPSNIGDIDNYDTGSEYNTNINGTNTNVNTYSSISEKVNVGQFSANDNLKIKDYYAFVFSMNSSNLLQGYPTASTGTMVVDIYKQGNNTVLQTYSYTINKVDNYGHYSYSGETNYTIPSAGVYQLKITLAINSPVSTSLTVVGSVNLNISHKVGHQTYIGLDGFISNPDTNCILWSGSDEIQMRWKDVGLRMNNYGLQTLTGYHYVNGVLKPTWLSVYNYTPIFYVGDGTKNYTQLTVAVINQTKYAYKLNPVTDIGICFALCAFNGSNVKQESWIILPSDSYTDENNETSSLPFGYSITIINESISPNNVDICVAPGNQYGLIYDDNRQSNNYSILSSSGKCSDTFIYMGNNVWRQLKDTQ